MRALGIQPWVISDWWRQGRLERVLPHVYALGHTASNHEADLWAAVLYAGPGAALSHRSAAHRRGLIDRPPPVIEVSTPRRAVGVPGVRIFRERGTGSRGRRLVRGIPTVSVGATVLGLAELGEQRLLRRALGSLDFARELDATALLAECRRGRRGAASLRAALVEYDPRLKYANGPLEERFLELCRGWRLPPPRLNARVHGILVDAYWPRAGLVVELDGHANHQSPGQRRRDRARELALRAHGLVVYRYDVALLTGRPCQVRVELLAALDGRE